jgi:hypothetical protein
VIQPKRLFLTVAAEKLTGGRATDVAATIQSFLERNGRTTLPAVSSTTVRGIVVYCTSRRTNTVLAGCGAVRPDHASDELVIAFVLHADPTAFHKQGGVDLIRRLVVSARDLVAATPVSPRKAP